ncbi:MAG: cobalt chelatase [Piscinibacter sp.]|uniref:cobaltochelatase CobT-related protein n=1 Tax=Piscinibacter sp. TaxID=1903157 RepID=UPI001B6F8590|nr:cobalt chelatase [Piscinibacter sp.]MBP5989431.1 cobalt chelatase [Piscinibacter sp.]MBP6027308.1 cobalt chelatase [Piscinibacter sp.]
MAEHAPAAARRQQQIEELCGAAVRALAGRTDLHFRARRLHQGEHLLPFAAPHLYPSLEEDDYASFRGATDALALRLTHSDFALHRRLAPPELARRFVFEVLEQLRVESLVPPDWPGARANLRHRFESWSAAWVASRQLEGTRGLLLYTLVQVTRSRLTGEGVYEPTEEAIESTRWDLMPRIGVTLRALQRTRGDQAAYAGHALALADTVVAMLAEQQAGDDRDDAGDGQTDAAPGFALLLEALEHEAEAPPPVAEHGDSRVLEAAGNRYAVFTRAYDEERGAVELARAEVLRGLRARLDELVAQSGLNVGRLARDFRVLLATPAPDDWTSGQEQGRIDGRRLSQLVANPAERRLFRDEHWQPKAQCVVSLLLDCSGSMKRHNEPLAALVDMLARALEEAGVGVEVLGFTTASWQGGRARRDWQRAGSPPHPGRLAERRHIVFKDLATTWRRARAGLAALLKNDLFREGVDGEAVEWACARLREAATDDTLQRRILIVVSDGSPMETATNLANDVHYLDHHLRQVVAREEATGGVEILGLGVGLDLSPYYGRCHTLALDGLPGRATFHEIMALVGGRHRR